jgi:hypothetical protein
MCTNFYQKSFRPKRSFAKWIPVGRRLVARGVDVVDSNGRPVSGLDRPSEVRHVSVRRSVANGPRRPRSLQRRLRGRNHFFFILFRRGGQSRFSLLSLDLGPI